jgi:cytochrome c-type biogenesis protein
MGERQVTERSILRRSVVSTLFFILGFTVIFVILGAGASSISGFLTRHMRLITIIGGGIIIILALQVMELFTIPFLNYQKSAAFKRKRKGVIGSFIIGVTFAAAWTPCIGPILSSILILAATKDTALKGVFLLAAYSVGLGLPFLFAAVAFSSFLSFSSFLKKNFRTIKLVSGILLLAIGLTLIIGQFQLLSRYLSFIPDYSLIESNRVSIVIALFAGFISFISPCVLPLIPSYLTFITGVSVMEAET